MFNAMTRARVIQLWFVAVAVAIAGAVVFGVAVTLSTAVLLLAASLVPPAIVAVMWPAGPQENAGDVIHAGDRQ
jgi:hypothetical protein